MIFYWHNFIIRLTYLILLLTVEWNWIKAMGFGASKEDFMHHLYQLLDVKNTAGFIFYVINYRQVGLAGLLKLSLFKLSANSSLFKACEKLLNDIKEQGPLLLNQ